jgi:transcriptional regulator with XRE-family HTH domain
MALGSNIQAWRLSRKQSVTTLAEKVGLQAAALDAIECGDLDPTASILERLANALGIPTSWLYGNPKHLTLLTTDPDGEASESIAPESTDPVIERVLQGVRQDQELYVLLTALIQSGEPKLLRAA